MADFRSSIPYWEIECIAGDDRALHFFFVDLNSPVPRPRYPFPPGTVFNFSAKGDVVNIKREAQYDTATRRVTVQLKPLDTKHIARDTKARWEMVGNFPDHKRYTLVRGDLFISAPWGLND